MEQSVQLLDVCGNVAAIVCVVSHVVNVSGKSFHLDRIVSQVTVASAGPKLVIDFICQIGGLPLQAGGEFVDVDIRGSLSISGNQTNGNNSEAHDRFHNYFSRLSVS